MRRIIIVSLIAFSSLCQAQKPVVSGYLGKTNYGMMKLNTGLRIDHPEKWKKASDVSTSHFDGVNFKSELEVIYGHIFSNRFILEAVVGFNSTSIDINSSYSSSFVYTTSSGYQSDYSYYYGFPKISDFYTGINTKFYRRKKGALAPIGFYYGLGLNYHTYAVHLNHIVAYQRTGGGGHTATNIDYGKYYFRFIEYNGSLGSTSAITDNLILDIGMSIGWGVPGPKFFEHDIPNESQFDSGLLEMLKYYQIGKVKIGLMYMF
jgi:hypothetical protein